VLKYKKCTIGVGVEKDKGDGYPDKNVIKYAKPYVENWNGGNVRGNSEKVAQANIAPGKHRDKPLDDAVPF
jgi:hypothetical protein